MNKRTFLSAVLTAIPSLFVYGKFKSRAQKQIKPICFSANFDQIGMNIKSCVPGEWGKIYSLDFYGRHLETYRQETIILEFPRKWAGDVITGSGTHRGRKCKYCYFRSHRSIVLNTGERINKYGYRLEVEYI